MNDEPIFQSVGQALSVSFLIMAHEPRAGSPFRKMLLQAMESLETMTGGQRNWFEQLRGVKADDSTINFGGLTADEVRAQCSLVTQAVRDHLPGPERDTVLARYGYQKEKGDGVIGLVQYVAPLLTIHNEEAIRAVAYGYFDSSRRKPYDAQKRIGGLSYQEISAFYGIHVKTLQRANAVIGRTADILLGMAQTRLTPMFVRDGLIDDASDYRAQAKKVANAS